jgi:hypothetical protein
VKVSGPVIIALICVVIIAVGGAIVMWTARPGGAPLGPCVWFLFGIAGLVAAPLAVVPKGRTEGDRSHGMRIGAGIVVLALITAVILLMVLLAYTTPMTFKASLSPNALRMG